MRRTLVVLVVVTAACAGGAASAQRPAAAKGREYELRLIRVGNTFQAVRFKVRTGEAWTMSGDRYKPIPETGPVPAGDYDITLVTDDVNWMAFRIDRVSGATGQMRGNKWVPVKEPTEKPE